MNAPQLHRLLNRSPLRHLLTALATGVLLNISIAYACTLWSPITSSRHPPLPPNNLSPPDIPGPNGSPGWWHYLYGFGWMSAAPSGARCSEEVDFLGWTATTTPAFHRAGFPLPSMQSVVTAVSTPDTGPLRRWQLPLSEIIRRGPNTSDLPTHLHAHPDRRLPLLPLFPGFAINSFLYALLCSPLLHAAARLRTSHQRRRGFPIIPTT